MEAVLETFYRNIGTPPPAPGIERLAFFAVEAAYTALREAWQDELLTDGAVDAAEKRLEEKMGTTLDRDLVVDVLAAAVTELPDLGDAGLPRSAE